MPMFPEPAPQSLGQLWLVGCFFRFLSDKFELSPPVHFSSHREIIVKTMMKTVRNLIRLSSTPRMNQVMIQSVRLTRLVTTFSNSEIPKTHTFQQLQQACSSEWSSQARRDCILHETATLQFECNTALWQSNTWWQSSWQETGSLDACIVGVPVDTATSNRPGTRFGPREIRSVWR